MRAVPGDGNSTAAGGGLCLWEDMRTTALIAALALGMFACGDDGDGGDGDAGGEPSSVASPECEALCEKAKTCDDASDLCGPSWCADSFDHLRTEIRAGLLSCSEAKDPFCQAELDECLGQALAAAPQRDADVAFQTACLQRSGECSFSFELCALGLFFDEAILADAEACLAKPCAEVEACLKGAFPFPG